MQTYFYSFIDHNYLKCNFLIRPIIEKIGITQHSKFRLQEDQVELGSAHPLAEIKEE